MYSCCTARLYESKFQSCEEHEELLSFAISIDDRVAYLQTPVLILLSVIHKDIVMHMSPKNFAPKSTSISHCATLIDGQYTIHGTREHDRNYLPRIEDPLWLEFFPSCCKSVHVSMYLMLLTYETPMYAGDNDELMSIRWIREVLTRSHRLSSGQVSTRIMKQDNELREWRTRRDKNAYNL